MQRRCEEYEWSTLFLVHFNFLLWVHLKELRHFQDTEIKKGKRTRNKGRETFSSTVEQRDKTNGQLQDGCLLAGSWAGVCKQKTHTHTHLCCAIWFQTISSVVWWQSDRLGLLPPLPQRLHVYNFFICTGFPSQVLWSLYQRDPNMAHKSTQQRLWIFTHKSVWRSHLQSD